MRKIKPFVPPTAAEFTDTDRRMMALAIEEARLAAESGDVPVGAVIARGDTVIAKARNLREVEKNATAHAEVLCIDEACRILGGWRLPGCTLYVTLEPCPMCAGAVINSRIERVVYGLKDAKSGSFGSVVNLAAYPYNHKPKIESGLMEKEAAEMLSEFFAARRGSATAHKE